ncbi:MAG: hypothetical protein AB7P03_04125 [Kofleriaceae bacterium]
MRLIAMLIVLGPLSVHGCSCGNDVASDRDAGADASTGNTFDQCDGDPGSFVRQAFLALDGRRPRSQSEVDVYRDLYAAANELGDDPKRVVARAIMSRPEFAARWTEIVMDALHVQRLDIQSEADCWDTPLRQSVTPALAMAVRDQPATASADGMAFTMLDLANSSLALDDLSPIYRAQLFSLVSHPIPAANVGRIDAELARRADFGETFDAAYLHRDTVCLGCHTSEMSVTDDDDPDVDRHWPVAGDPERAVYGDPKGVAAERAHAMFRVDDFVRSGAQRPWGWSSRCGSFASRSSVGDDLAGVDAKLASVTGTRSTVYDLEAALARGLVALRGQGVVAGTAITDPDTALAWLVVLKISEDVWREATGTNLTIANYFPRNQAASELLHALANTFAQSGFSLKELLTAIVSSDYFNRQLPEAGCGRSPYTYPNVFDPWVTADPDPERRHNGPGDAVTPIAARALTAATAAALEWPAPPVVSRFPDYGEGCELFSCAQLAQACQDDGQCCTTHAAACVMNGWLPANELAFQRGVGMFLRNSERGFRGLDFQARLHWEDRYGSCTKPGWVTEDFIDRLVATAAAHPNASVEDVVEALKDRLIGEPSVADGAERTALATMLGDLGNPASAVTSEALRTVCGAVVASPQFLLQGVAGRGGDRPLLTPVNVGYQAICGDLATNGIGISGRVVTCGDDTLTLAAARTVTPPVVRAPAVTAEPPLRRRPPPPRQPAPTHRF